MPRHSHLREDGTQANDRVSAIELFFDLVFVFAVTQLSHYLLEHHNVAGALQTLLMFLAVWWAWIYTAWATNWLDPDHAPVRLVLIAVMLLSLVLSSAIPGAFGEYGLHFRAGLCGDPGRPDGLYVMGEGRMATSRFEEHGEGHALLRRVGCRRGSSAGSKTIRCCASPGGSRRSSSNIRDRNSSFSSLA